MDKAGETLEREGTRKAGENARCRADGQRQKHHFRGALIWLVRRAALKRGERERGKYIS